ncbi:MAG TPA: C4-dicarboxylate ABC transporter permease, partial [Synergistaceae bacterium]|nr:C4-dicarboxylate ABC transporter permease [Synergistaceae bacterium]
IASYGAAGLSGQNPSKVGWTGFRISLAGFLIPFTFVNNPELLLVGGTTLSRIVSTATSFVGVLILAAALQNYFLRPMNLLQRAMMFVGSILLIFPGLTTDIMGVVLAGSVYLWQKASMKEGVAV